MGGESRLLCHSSAFANGRVFAFGGLTPRGCVGSLWELEIDLGGWRQIVTKSACSHSAVSVHEAPHYFCEVILYLREVTKCQFVRRLYPVRVWN